MHVIQNELSSFKQYKQFSSEQILLKFIFRKILTYENFPVYRLVLKRTSLFSSNIFSGSVTT